MDNNQKLEIIKRNLEEVLTEEDLKKLLETETPLRHYIGFEISGKLHIGHFFQLLKVKDLQDAGAETIIWLADLHSAVNDKLGGNLEDIKRLSWNYFAPALKVLFQSIGGDPEKLQFKLCSEEYAKNPDFWLTFLEMGKNTTLARSKRSITIMGREEAEDTMETAKIMYPIMQAADIYLLQVNIAQAGIDQRKVHVVARESAHKIETFALKDKNGNKIKPVAIHTPILLGLNFSTLPLDFNPEEVLGKDLAADELAMRTKMSKSKANDAVSVHDDPEDIRKKINGAFAPEGQTTANPILNWTKFLIFYNPDTTFTVTRPEKWGGNLTYTNFEDLEKDYADKNLHPQDLKLAVAEWLINKLEPIRNAFGEGDNKTALEEIDRLATRISPE